MNRVLSVDLGATSVRVAAVDLDGAHPEVDVLHRWRHTPVPDSEGYLRWDWDGIVGEVEKGLHIGLDSGRVDSIGVDGWGVDYGYLDESGRLVDQPFAYRDPRTASWEEIADSLGRDRLYRTTGIQLMGINTIFQIAVDSRDRVARAERLLLLPDLLVNHLTGWSGAERSNVSTTGLMSASTRGWSDELIDAVGVPRSLFPEPADAGVLAGEWRETPVYLVGSHDTASAFLGAPGGRGSVFVSTGSWVIVGVERDTPDVSPAARAANFSNEAGALGGVRFLKNVVGFWILERCRDAWGVLPMSRLVEEAEAVEHPVPTFDASDQRYVTATDMLAEVLAATGLPTDAPRGVVVRAILESVVEGVCAVIDEIVDTTGEPVGRISLVGGGSRIDLFRRLLAKRAGRVVVVGSPEAAALGNAVVQGIALGRFSDLAEARSWLAPAEVAP